MSNVTDERPVLQWMQNTWRKLDGGASVVDGVRKGAREIARGLRKTTMNPLERALYDAQNSARIGHQTALQSIDSVEQAIEKSSTSIRERIEALQTGNAKAGEATESLQKQLVELVDELHKTAKTTRIRLEEREKELHEFSVTLFGRTTAGKSTLMEILTKGDGDSIGKGAQRTTRDVRAYNWKGLRVIDVPGIAAFEGDEDEEVAYKAAAKADLVLFLFSDNAPQPAEAEGVKKIRAWGKPIIGVCNVKLALAPEILENEKRLELFFRDLERKGFNEQRTNDLKQQFQDLIEMHIPGYSLNVIFTHLLSYYLAQKVVAEPHRARLEAASRFHLVEEAIIQEVIGQGKFLREKSFIDGALVPLVKLSDNLLDFSQQNASIGRTLLKNREKLSSWRASFRTSGRAQIEAFCNKEFGALDRIIPGFAEKHYESSDAGEQWEAKVKEYEIEAKVQALAESLGNQCSDNTSEFTRELTSELALVSEFAADRTIAMESVSNMKKISKRIGDLGVTIGLTILSFSNFAGWVAGAVGLFAWIFSWFQDPRAAQANRQRAKLTKQLRADLKRMKKVTQEDLVAWFEKELLNHRVDVVADGLAQSAESVSELAEEQRALAWLLVKEQKKLHHDLLKSALNKQEYEELSEVLVDVARIPGHGIMLKKRQGTMMNGFSENKFKEKIGEQLWVVDESITSKALLSEALNLSVRGKHVKIEADKKVAFIPSRNLSAEESLRVRLVQQLDELHVMKQ